MIYEEAYGDFGPIRMSPKELEQMYREIGEQKREQEAER